MRYFLERISVLLLATCVLLVTGCEGEEGRSKLQAIDELYTKSTVSFPAVKSLSVDQLLELSGNEAIILIDVRETYEQEVSTIPGAITKEELQKNLESHRAKKIVPYCTIGYRSGLYAQELIEKDFDVLNLKGGILAWTHGGQPLADKNGETKRVHVYGKKWALAAEGYEQVW